MKYLKNVARLEYNISKCTGCGMCAVVCPHGVFEIAGNKAVITDKDLCMECGACMMNCASGALTVEKGVGCAYAVITSRLKRQNTVSCGCGSDQKKTSCC